MSPYIPTDNDLIDAIREMLGKRPMRGENKPDQNRFHVALGEYDWRDNRGSKRAGAP